MGDAEAARCLSCCLRLRLRRRRPRPRGVEAVDLQGRGQDASGRDAGLLQGHRYWRWRGRRNPRHLLHGRAQSGLILGSVLAYASTTSSKFGGYAESAGETAVKVYDKTLELNAQYDLLPKIKSATDTVVVAGSNLDKNYGFTSKIDEQLKISQAIDKATSKVDELKSSVTGKLEDLKAKASE